METIILQFPSIQLLWRFALENKINIFKIDARKIKPKLIGEYYDRQIKIALTKYHARVAYDNLLNAAV